MINSAAITRTLSDSLTGDVGVALETTTEEGIAAAVANNINVVVINNEVATRTTVAVGTRGVAVATLKIGTKVNSTSTGANTEDNQIPIDSPPEARVITKAMLPLTSLNMKTLFMMTFTKMISRTWVMKAKTQVINFP